MEGPNYMEKGNGPIAICRTDYGNRGGLGIKNDYSRKNCRSGISGNSSKRLVSEVCSEGNRRPLPGGGTSPVGSKQQIPSEPRRGDHGKRNRKCMGRTIMGRQVPIDNNRGNRPGMWGKKL